MNSYKNTAVHWGKSQAKICQLLSKHGVQDVRFTMMESQAKIICEFNYPQIVEGNEINYGVRLEVPLPKCRAGLEEKIKNQVHRALFYYLKVKFEAMQFGLMEFLREFLPHIIITDKNGRQSTVYNLLEKQVSNGYLSGKQTTPLLEMK